MNEFRQAGGLRRGSRAVDDLLGETEDIFGDILGGATSMVGNVLGNVPVVGGLVRGVLGGGGGGGAPPAPIGSASAQAPAGGLLGGLGGLVPALGQGVTQALQAIPAASPIGSVLGTGLGGVAGGTGPLPDPLGLFAQRHFGTNALPPASTVDPTNMLQGPWRDLANHSERVGRAIIKRLLDVTDPQLAEVRAWIRQRGAQLQATGEHRNIMSDMDFKANVINYLLAISRYLNLPTTPGAPGSIATPNASLFGGGSYSSRSGVKRY